MRKLNLGCGRDIRPGIEGWVNLDAAARPGVDVVFNLEQCAVTRMPFADGEFSQINASHVIEHIRETLPLMEELHRITEPDGNAVFMCPYGSSDDAFEDPTHVRQYFLNSFGYFSQPAYWRADYGYRGDWQPERVVLRVSAEKFREWTAPQIMATVLSSRNVVKEMRVSLRCIKPIREPKKELQQSPQITIQKV